MKKKIAIYPGTFDPITNGHIDIVDRARKMFDEVIISIAQNPKKTPLFSVEERKGMIRESIVSLENIEVDAFEGLLVQYASMRNAVAIIRGLRAISDFEYEFQMAMMNRKLRENIATVFLMPHENYIYLNSSIVKEVAYFGEDVSHLVPEIVVKRLKEKFSNNSNSVRKI
ncbi:pantetheine-phosphate adenylyltransferase [candidate division KSB1 bacterium]|nr:pantetheine-phosphate adenylyltransferase [candidate division KSB1 bacterium]